VAIVWPGLEMLFLEAEIMRQARACLFPSSLGSWQNFPSALLATELLTKAGKLRGE